MGIKGSKVGSMSNLRDQLKRSEGGFIRTIPKDGMTVRFLTEPTEWFQYEEFAGPNQFPRPLMEGQDIPEGCRKSRRFVANVLDVTKEGETKQIVLKLPISVVKRLDRRFEKFGTLTDRDYELSKIGEGLDTEYEVSAGAKANPPSPWKRDSDGSITSKEAILDLLAALETEAADDGKKTEEKPTKSKRRTVQRDEDGDPIDDDADDEDDDDTDEDDESGDDDEQSDDEDDESGDDEQSETWQQEIEALGALADGDDEEEADAAIDRLTEVAGEYNLDPDEYETWADLATAIVAAMPEAPQEPESDDPDEDDDSDDEGDSEYSEDELNAMTLGQLRALAKANGVPSTGLKRDALVKRLMEA